MVIRNPHTPNRLTSILISRFLLDLQAVHQRSTGLVSSSGSRFESAVFERVIGSLSGSTDFGGDAGVDDIEENGVRGEHGNLDGIDKSSVHTPKGIEDGTKEETCVGN